jgi:hypothetical protein
MAMKAGNMLAKFGILTLLRNSVAAIYSGPQSQFYLYKANFYAVNTLVNEAAQLFHI